MPPGRQAHAFDPPAPAPRPRALVPGGGLAAASGHVLAATFAGTSPTFWYHPAEVHPRPLSIEPVRADDTDATRLLNAYFEELGRRLGGFDPARSVSADPEEMSPPNGTFLVIYENGAAVACGGLKALGPEVAEIKRMFVAPEARGRGHGRRLLAVLEDSARAMGRRRIVLDTAAPLEEAAGLYVSAGYRPIGPYNQNPYAARWFEKEL